MASKRSASASSAATTTPRRLTPLEWNKREKKFVIGTPEEGSQKAKKAKNDLPASTTSSTSPPPDLCVASTDPVDEGFRLLHLRIFSFLPSTDLGRCRCVSKNFYCGGLEALQDPSHPKKPFTDNGELRQAVLIYHGGDLREFRRSWGIIHYGQDSSFPFPETQGEPYNPTYYDLFRVHCLYGHVLGRWDVSKIANFSDIFSAVDDFNEPLQWDTRNATDMSRMFSGCCRFNSSLGPKFCTSNVTCMHQMFFGCDSFNQDVSHFDTSMVTNMSGMFSFCNEFKQSLEAFDMSSVVEIEGMLEGARHYTKYRQQYGKLFPVHVWGWDLSKRNPHNPHNFP